MERSCNEPGHGELWKEAWAGAEPPLEPPCLLVVPGKLLQVELRVVIFQAASSRECLHAGCGWERKEPLYSRNLCNHKRIIHFVVKSTWPGEKDK